MRRPRPAAVVLIAVLILSGCSSERQAAGPQAPGSSPTVPGTEGGGGEIRACDLLAAAEVSGALGGEPAQAAATGGSRCSWTSASGTVTASIVEDACPATPPEGSSPVEGLGVPAWWTYVQAEVGVGTITACPDGRRLEVVVTGNRPEEEARAGAEALAGTALQRLTA